MKALLAVVLTACVGADQPTGEVVENSTVSGVGFFAVAYNGVSLMGWEPSQPFTIVNNGATAAKLGQVSITGANAADFAITEDTCSGTTLAPGTLCQVLVDFVPQNPVASTRTAELTLPTSAGALTSNMSVTIVTSITATVSPTALAFGSVVVGTSATRSVTITNTSAAAFPAANTGFYYSYSGPGSWSDLAQSLLGTSCPGLAPGASCTTSVVFAPSAFGAMTASMWWWVGTWNNAQVVVATMPITGSGTHALPPPPPHCKPPYCQ
jgi:hypothetical protein